YLPVVRELMTLDEVLTKRDLFDLKLIAHEEEQPDSIRSLSTDKLPKNILMLVGPEGGFTPEEVLRCRTSGFQTVYLGERRLRTETAAVVMAALSTLIQ
ncbi:MAG TPA: RsmE family RNA methyltransferase, partial [Bacteroidota bacterium]|nr:RsmE family RNA methyltransferase [Bacteroidota bacterium]